MRNLKINFVLGCFMLLLGCLPQEKRREVPNDEILKAIKSYIINEKGFKSLKEIKLLKAEEVILTNKKTLKTKKNYIVWKALAKVNHLCEGCPILDLENNTALFIITEDESKHFEARLHTISLKGMNPGKLYMYKSLNAELETTSRYAHTKGAELNDEQPYIWTNEEYSYPTDLIPTKIDISRMDNIIIDQKETLLEIKGDGIFIIWNKKIKNLLIIDALAKTEQTLKEGDKPVTVDDYFSFFGEGRRIKFVVESETYKKKSTSEIVEIDSIPIVLQFNDQIVTLEEVAVGQVAPDFIQNDVNGAQVKFSEIYTQNDLTLLYFWAAWCGPCRAENPNVVAVNNEFKTKGFTVFGVSLDREKEDWVKAIADDKLAWTQVSDLSFMQNEVARMYNIQSIPSSVLVDRTGKIVAKNKRGDDLRKFLAEKLK
jgi:peroxiredoxin